MGELKTYSANVEPKRFKINGQYGWSPKVLHPYIPDASILKASKVMYNYDKDYKWTIGEDGYYRITIDLFHETIKGEYFGAEPPTGFGQMLEDASRITVSGRSVHVQGFEVATVRLIGAGGQLCDVREGTDVWLTAPARGIYVVSVESQHASFTKKVVVE